MTDDELLAAFEGHFLAIETEDDRRQVIEGLRDVAHRVWREGQYSSIDKPNPYA